MKIGILTFHETNNFGSLLQTYGLYKALVDQGENAEVIAFQCKEISRREFKHEHLETVSMKGIVKYLYFSHYFRKKHKELLNFLYENAKVGESYSKANISEANENYDIFVVGSDLVWATDVTGNDFTYFLDFTSEEKKRISYASSANSIENDLQKEIIIEYLKRFQNISVREYTIKEQLDRMLGRRVEFVCDPTMLVDQKYWVEMAQNSCLSARIDDKKYVLLYFKDADGKMICDAKYLADKNNLEIWYINDGRPIKGIKNLRVTKIEDFLCLILHAKCVLSGSYHGVLFSMYFERDFFYYVRAHGTRMRSLSEFLNIEDRNAENIANGKDIDYAALNHRIEIFRRSSQEYLQSALRG